MGNQALIAIFVALVSAAGSIFAVIQNRRTDDRKTNVSEFEAIVAVLQVDNRELRDENRQLKARLNRAEARLATLEGRQ
jgi:outer membrane murein-binding lipoprotein Lpp